MSKAKNSDLKSNGPGLNFANRRMNRRCSLSASNRERQRVVEPARMNPATRGIDADLGPRNADSFHRNLHLRSRQCGTNLVPVRKDLANAARFATWYPPASIEDPESGRAARNVAGTS
jgi:hypothetical protein